MARVFVVDDEPDMVDLLATILKSDGFQVETDTDGRSALARLLATDSILWILDEPFTSLDRDSMAMFASLFEQHLEHEGLIVMTSHHDISLPGQSVQRLQLGAAA